MHLSTYIGFLNMDQYRVPSIWMLLNLTNPWSSKKPATASLHLIAMILLLVLAAFVHWVSRRYPIFERRYPCRTPMDTSATTVLVGVQCICLFLISQ